MEHQSFEELTSAYHDNAEQIEALDFSITRLHTMMTDLMRTNQQIRQAMVQLHQQQQLPQLPPNPIILPPFRNNRQRQRARESRESVRRSERAIINRLFQMTHASNSSNNNNNAAITPPLPALVTEMTTGRRRSYSTLTGNDEEERKEEEPTARDVASDLLFEYEIPFTQLNSFMEMVQHLGEPVDVQLTPAEIEAATRTAHYADIPSPRNTTCPIQLDPFQDRDLVAVIRGCGHIFHRDALMQWFERNHLCPMCRLDVRQHQPSSSFRSS